MTKYKQLNDWQKIIQRSIISTPSNISENAEKNSNKEYNNTIRIIS